MSLSKRRKTPAELYALFEPRVDLDAGLVYVGFKPNDPEENLAVREGRTGREHLNTGLAQNALGALSFVGAVVRVFSRAAQIFTSYFAFEHCEVAFALSEPGKKVYGPDKLLAVLVNGRENVTIKQRHFHGAYKWHALRATRAELVSMLKFACTTAGERFAAAVRDRVATFPGDDATTPGWYCTKHTATMLRSLDCAMFHLTRPNTVTTDELYHMVEMCGHAPARHNDVKTPIQMEQLFGVDAMNRTVYAKYGKTQGASASNTATSASATTSATTSAATALAASGGSVQAAASLAFAAPRQLNETNKDR